MSFLVHPTMQCFQTERRQRLSYQSCIPQSRKPVSVLASFAATLRAGMTKSLTRSKSSRPERKSIFPVFRRTGTPPRELLLSTRPWECGKLSMRTWMMRLARPGIRPVRLVRGWRGLDISTKVWWSVILVLSSIGLVSSRPATWKHGSEY